MQAKIRAKAEPKLLLEGLPLGETFVFFDEASETVYSVADVCMDDHKNDLIQVHCLRSGWVEGYNPKSHVKRVVPVGVVSGTVIFEEV